MEFIPAMLMFLLMAAIFVALVAWAIHSRRKLQETWGQAAAQRNLHYTPGGLFSNHTLAGQQGDRALEVDIHARSHGKSSTTYTRARVSTRRPMPPGMKLTRESFLDKVGKALGGQDVQIGDAHLDSKLRLKTRSPDSLRAMFADPRLRQHLERFTERSDYSSVEEGDLTLEQVGIITHEIDGFIDEAVGLVAALDDARIRPWQQVASQHHLALTDQGDALTLTGTWRGHAVVINVNLRRDHALIDVPVDGLPAGLSVVAGSSPDAVRLGDPVLDGMITAKGDDPETLRRLLRDDALRGELLSVVHAWPGSSVLDRGVRLVLPDTAAADLEARLDDAVALAARLGQRARQEARAGQAMRPRQTQQRER